MSISISVSTPNKNEIAEVLKAIANWIKESSNETILIDLAVTFEAKK